MKKCDFCTQLSPDGECFWSAKTAREDYCKEAIKQMVKGLGNSNRDTMRVHKRGKTFR